MNRVTDRVSRERAAQSVVLAVMLLLLLFCIAMTGITEAFLRRDAFVNSMVDIVGLVLLILLFLFSSYGASGRDKQMFQLLTVHVFAAVFFSCLGNTFYGRPDCVRGKARHPERQSAVRLL